MARLLVATVLALVVASAACGIDADGEVARDAASDLGAPVMNRAHDAGGPVDSTAPSHDASQEARSNTGHDGGHDAHPTMTGDASDGRAKDAANPADAAADRGGSTPDAPVGDAGRETGPICILSSQGDQGDAAVCCTTYASGGSCACITFNQEPQGGAKSCCSGTLTVLSACGCIANGVDQGTRANCCGGDDAGTCGCIAQYQDDEGSPMNCCAGSLNAFGECGCIAKASDRGDPSNCCTGAAVDAGVCGCIAQYQNAAGDPASCCSGTEDPSGNCM